MPYNSILTSRADPTAPAYLVDRNACGLARKGSDIKFPKRKKMESTAKSRRDTLVNHAVNARQRFMVASASDTPSSSLSSSPAPPELSSRSSSPLVPPPMVRKRKSADLVVLGQDGLCIPSPEKKKRRLVKGTGIGWDLKKHPSFG